MVVIQIVWDDGGRSYFRRSIVINNNYTKRKMTNTNTNTNIEVEVEVGEYDDRGVAAAMQYIIQELEYTII